MTNKLDIGTVLSRTFRTYGDQATLLIPAALLVFLPVAILSGLAFTAGSVVGLILATLLGALGGVLFQGMVVEAARDMLDGRRDQTIGGLITGAAPVIVPLLIAGLLVGIATAAGVLLLIVGTFLVATIFYVTAPAIVVERAGAIDAMRRSIELVRPYFLPVLGVLVVVLLINYVAGFVLRALFSAVDDGALGYSLATLVTQMLVAPIGALAAAIVYFELKRLHREPVDAGGPSASVAHPASAGPPPTS